jgi:FkbM family methyltransferase
MKEMGIEKPIIFDVGAHHGNTSRKFRRIFPKAIVYAFEPFRDSFARLKTATEEDLKIKCFNYGLSEHNGSQPFHSNPFSATNSLFSTDEMASNTWKPGILETKGIVHEKFKTLDSVISTLAVQTIDILKLDVQGAEHLVMKGSVSACQNHTIKCIYTEIIIQPTYNGQKRFDQALSVFYECGFDLYNIYNMSHNSKGKLRQIDAIFTR